MFLRGGGGCGGGCCCLLRRLYSSSHWLPHTVYEFAPRAKLFRYVRTPRGNEALVVALRGGDDLLGMGGDGLTIDGVRLWVSKVKGQLHLAIKQESGSIGAQQWEDALRVEHALFARYRAGELVVDLEEEEEGTLSVSPRTHPDLFEDGEGKSVCWVVEDSTIFTHTLSPSRTLREC